MAKITTFSTLKTAVADYLEHSGISAAGGWIDVAIGLLESELYGEHLRLRFMESALSVAIGSGVAAIPADFLELKHAYIDGTPTYPLQPQAAAWIYANFSDRTASNTGASYIAQDVDNFIFGPVPASGTLKGTYYATQTALGTGNETNWLTTNAPDLLLFGTLVQSVPFLGDDERARVPSGWREGYEKALARVKAQQRRERFPDEMPLRAAAG